MVLLRARWGKKEFDFVFNPEDDILSQIACLTHIPKDKIKLIPQSVTNPAFVPKDGMRITIVGTAEDKQLSTEERYKANNQFVEDMTEEEIATALRQTKADPLPVGLENLGNTCYLNAVVQCLCRLPMFNQGIVNFQPRIHGDLQIYSQMSGLLSLLTSSHSDFETPATFVATVRNRFPRFNQRDSHGHYSQQDADEFLRELLQSLASVNSSIDSMFSFGMETSLKCLDSEAEPISTISEELKSLTCHMGTQVEPVNHLHEGIQLSLKEVIEKKALCLERSAKFEKRSGMKSLPPYLMVQLARFQWKAKSDSAGTQATKTKIIRKVAFQKTLDVYDFCSDSVKSHLDIGRERRRRLVEDSGGSPVEEFQIADQDSTSEELFHSQRLPTGVYELVAIVSHQGRTSDGGHYMAWTKRVRRPSEGPPPSKKTNGSKDSPDSEIWLKFDDETVSETSWTAMTETGGMLGGLADSQMAYLLFYARTSVSKQDI